MIHASWLYDLIHQLKLLETRKVHTSTNPADITTKQIGMSAETFEKHTRSLLGLNDLVYIDEQYKQVNYLNYNTFGEVKEHTNEEQKINLQRQAINAIAHIVNIENKPAMISVMKNKTTGQLVGISYLS